MGGLKCCCCGVQIPDDGQHIFKIARWKLPACSSCRMLGVQLLKNVAGLRGLLAKKGILVGVPKQ